MKRGWSEYLPEGANPCDPMASPLFVRDTTALPPASLLTAEFDTLRDDGDAYARKLIESGSLVQVRRCLGAIHGFFAMPGALSISRQAMRDGAEFLRFRAGECKMDDAPNRSPVATVSVAGLCKRYGSSEAVSAVSFEVGVGQIFALLGPNGAGKTTTLECILGLRQPDAGSIRINGLDLRTQARQAKLLVGAQLQAATLQDRITPRQAIDLFGSFYPRRFPGEELLLRFHLEEKADAPFATLSGGQRQHLFLALALVNQPTLLVLDEPTAGLDPQARRELRCLIQEMRAEGRTVRS